MALGAHLLPPLPPSMLRFTGIESYSYTEQRKVNRRQLNDGDQTGDPPAQKAQATELRLLLNSNKTLTVDTIRSLNLHATYP